MGPLAGVKILEVAGVGPGPFAAMLLSNLGADVLRLHRPGETALLPTSVLGNGQGADQVGRPAVAADLKSPAGRQLALTLASSADALIEGFRPGVMERLGLGPDELLARNPALVYCRITGYGQFGPLAAVPGHDINYLALSGVLGAISRAGDRPLFPLNLLADYGGGGMLLALGLVSGLLEARRSGRGQVVDAAMVEGVAQLATVIFGLAETGGWGAPGTNVLDSGAHFYEVYETSDGGFMAVGAIEPRFYARLLAFLGLAADDYPQWDRARWPEFRTRFAQVFASRTRAEWTELTQLADACVTPVLTLAEAPDHPHNAARGTFPDRGGRRLPRSAPRFDRTPADDAASGRTAADALADWGLPASSIEELRSSGALS